MKNLLAMYGAMASLATATHGIENTRFNCKKKGHHQYKEVREEIKHENWTEVKGYYICDCGKELGK